MACSVRNDDISNDWLACTKSASDGKVSFCFSEDKEKAQKYSTMYYLENLEEEIDAESDGTSKFYIVINNPKLEGYDENFKTIIQTCATSDIYGNKLFITLEKETLE